MCGSVGPGQFAGVRDRVLAALGGLALVVEHVGSTAVPGLPAKPVIDVDLIVADSSRESDYVPRLVAVGFELAVRFPAWEEHRVLRGWEPLTNLHVCSPDAVETRRHVVFRDWLSTHREDRDAYAATKRALAAEGFTDTMAYNARKAALVYDIYERIFAADPDHPHTPQPRPA